jgi:hypothetical protein
MTCWEKGDANIPRQMQIDHVDRAIVKIDHEYFQLIIPVKKAISKVVLLTFFAILSLLIIVYMILYIIFLPSNADGFYILWTCGFSLAFIPLIRVLLWNTIGKEIITIKKI